MRMMKLTVLGATILLLAGSAVAQESVSHELARKHYELGKSYYDIANYTQALESFKKAYELQPLPALLFNIARCYEVMGDLQQAISYYRLYLAKQPDANNRSVVDLRVKNLERRLEAERQAKAASPSGAQTPLRAPAGATPAATPGEGETVQATASSPLRWKKVAGWTAVGVGVASLGAGIALGAMVRSKSDEYSDGVKAGKTYYDLNQISSSAHGYQNGEIALLVVGGVVAAAGVGLVVWDALGARERPASTSARFAPFVGTNGFGLCGSGRF